MKFVTEIHCYDAQTKEYICSHDSVSAYKRSLGITGGSALGEYIDNVKLHRGCYLSRFKVKNLNTPDVEAESNNNETVEAEDDLANAILIKNEILLNRTKGQVKDSKRKELSYIKVISELETRLEVFEGLQVDPVEYKIEARTESTKEATVIGVISDIHIEERVDLKIVNNLNEYNPDIAITRINAFFRNFVFLTKRETKHYTVKDAVIYILGDNISGYIHEELKENNYLSPLEAIALVRDTLYNGLKYIIDNSGIETLHVVCKFGNHARLTQRKSFATGYKNNLDYFCYKNLEQLFNVTIGYENIKFVIEDGEITYFNIYDYVTRCGHGDHFKYMGGVGGVVIPLMRKLKDWDSIKKADMTILGHWHKWTPGAQYLINGTVIGISPYGLNFASAEDLVPKQSFMLCVKTRGFTTRTPIFLD